MTPQAAAAISAGDTAWVLTSGALVLLMTVGLALFYGGLVRPKNALNTMMMSVVALGVVGYSLAFAPGSAVLGGLGWVLFRGYVLFLLFWSFLVYDPLAHWVWGQGGWLASRGALDFAGGGVFATKLANPGGSDGVLAGNAAQLGVQLVAVLAAVALAVVGTTAAYALVRVTVGARATVHDELSGLDHSEHGEEAYFGGDVGAVAGPGLALGSGVIVARQEPHLVTSPSFAPPASPLAAA